MWVGIWFKLECFEVVKNGICKFCGKEEFLENNMWFMGYGKLDVDDVYGYRYGNIGCVIDGWIIVIFGGLECFFENSLLYLGDCFCFGEFFLFDFGELFLVFCCFDFLFFFLILNGIFGDFGGGFGEELVLWGLELVCVLDLVGFFWFEMFLRDFFVFEVLKFERKIKLKIIIG